MANTINPYLMNYQNASQMLNFNHFNQKSGNQKNTAANQSALPQQDNNYNLSLSTEGLDALQNQDTAANIDTGIFF